MKAALSSMPRLWPQVADMDTNSMEKELLAAGKTQEEIDAMKAKNEVLWSEPQTAPAFFYLVEVPREDDEGKETDVIDLKIKSTNIMELLGAFRAGFHSWLLPIETQVEQFLAKFPDAKAPADLVLRTFGVVDSKGCRHGEAYKD